MNSNEILETAQKFYSEIATYYSGHETPPTKRSIP